MWPISNEFSALPSSPPRGRGAFGALVSANHPRTKWSCEISGCGIQSCVLFRERVSNCERKWEIGGAASFCEIPESVWKCVGDGV